MLHVFKAKYDATSSEYTYRQQLHELKRVNNEPLSEFAYRVENLVNKAYPNSQEKESRILDAFVAGVDQKLADKYYEAAGKKPDGSAMLRRELIAFFERFEHIWKIPLHSQVSGAKASPSSPSQFDELSQHVSALQAQVVSLNTRENSGKQRSYGGQQTSRNGRTRSQRQKESFYCHSTSHFWNDCGARRQENPSWTPQQWQNNLSQFVRGASADYQYQGSYLNI